MIWFLANWKIVASSVATFGLCLMLHTLDVNRIEANQAEEITKVKAAIAAECTKAQAITEKVSHGYQTKLSALNSRLAAAHRMRDNSCVSVKIDPASRHDATAPREKSFGRDVGSDRLIEIAGKGEKYRLQLISCQQFINLENGVSSGD